MVQGWTLTYFETCPFGQVRVVFTCPKNEDTSAQNFLPGANWQDFMFLQLFWHRRGVQILLVLSDKWGEKFSCPTVTFSCPGQSDNP